MGRVNVRMNSSVTNATFVFVFVFAFVAELVGGSGVTLGLRLALGLGLLLNQLLVVLLPKFLLLSRYEVSAELIEEAKNIC